MGGRHDCDLRHNLAVSTIFIKGARLQSLCGVSSSSRDQRRDHLRS
jgi:hypothetical protein